MKIKEIRVWRSWNGTCNAVCVAGDDKTAETYVLCPFEDGVNELRTPVKMCIIATENKAFCLLRALAKLVFDGTDYESVGINKGSDLWNAIQELIDEV